MMKTITSTQLKAELDAMVERAEGQASSSSPATGSELRISGETARIIIANCHAIMRHRFRQVPLWSLVGQITGHGSGNSIAICNSANLDPHQSAGVKTLRAIPNTDYPERLSGE